LPSYIPDGPMTGNARAGDHRADELTTENRTMRDWPTRENDQVLDFFPALVKNPRMWTGLFSSAPIGG
jgi:hypothetical protein